MNGPLIPIILAIVVAVPLAVAIVVFVIAPIFRAIGTIISRTFTFVFAEIGEIFRFLGAKITAICYVPMVLFNAIFGRWSRAQHYGRALQGEVVAALASLYRMFLGHPARLFGAQRLVEGLEERIPQTIANAPPGTAAELRQGAGQANLAGGGAGGPQVSASRSGQFPGYTVIGTLAGGGSGAKLYVARPDERKLQAFARQALGPVGDVVIKSFSMAQGSSLPQIVRENHALAAAKKLGLVLEHELTNERFFYVMRYVPGDSLGIVTQRLHAASAPSGLSGKELSSAIGYVCDLLGTLHEYHRTGLWHKDVKPDNVIVSGGHAHLVDFGLVTPLRSSMTLTTHGTEYFRDPEMVKLALRGVKVHEVDGAKFDIFAAGAVMFSILENSFPEHGGLSQITKACPDALRWIVRRAMTDYDKRYPTAQAMLTDLAVVSQAALSGTLSGLRPADLPSVKAAELGETESLLGASFGPESMPTPLPAAPPPPSVGRWHGATAGTMAAIPVTPVGMDFLGAAGNTPVGGRRTPGRSAVDQLAAARGRAAEMRRRAAARIGRVSRAKTDANYGVAIATMLLVMVAVGGIGGFMMLASSPNTALPMVHVENGDLMYDVTSDGRVRVTRSNGESVDEGEIDVPDMPEMPEMPEAPEMPAMPQMPKAPEAARAAGGSIHLSAGPNGRSVKISGAASGKAGPAKERAARTAESASLSGATILVLEEPMVLDSSPYRVLQRAVDAMRSRGARVLTPSGGDSERSIPGMDNDQYVSLATELRVVVGLKPLDSEDAARAVNQWLKNHGGSIDAVMWATPNPKQAEDAAFRVYKRPEMPAEMQKGLGKALQAARE